MFKVGVGRRALGLATSLGFTVRTMSAAPPTASAKASNVSWEKDVSVDGAYKRKDAEFRSWISAEPDAEFPAAAGRYHFYVSYACPWASRCLAMIKHKGLDDVFTVDGTTQPG